MAIEQLRKKLVDLTLRNKLLTMRLDRGPVVRIVDEVPSQIFEGLMNGHAWTFDALPEPTPAQLRALNPDTEESLKLPPRPDERVWAKQCDIDPSFELPLHPKPSSKRHADRRLQTLLYKDKLETIVRRLAADSRSAIDETGSNMLFLGLGLLEWQEPKAGVESKKHVAPLVLVPVRLERAPVSAGLRTFRLEWNGEDVQDNLALRLLLDKDHSIVLPEFDEETGINKYFEAVQRAVQTQDQWRVVPQAYVTLISQLGKLLLYNDLDPKNWFNGAGIQAHNIVGKLLGASDSAGSELSFEEHEEVSPETIAQELDLPITDRIDSSQLEALRLAMSGQSFVIQGPPGTGKSQTITNIIAAVLASGKSVLFVAEKLAAIEVVKRRLDAMGLGVFCLELHSNRHRKKSFLETVGERLDLGRVPALAGLDERRARLSARRETIGAYVRAISREVMPERTVADVFFAAGKSAFPVGAAASELIDNGIPSAIEPLLPLDSGSLHVHRDGYDKLTAFAPALADMRQHGDIAHHPWADVTCDSILQDDLPKVRTDLSSLRVQAAQANQTGERILNTIGADLDQDDQLLEGPREQITNLTTLRDLLPVLRRADEDIERVRSASGLPIPQGRAAIVAVLSCAKLVASAPFDALPLFHDALLGASSSNALADAANKANSTLSNIARVRASLPNADWKFDASLHARIERAIGSFASSDLLHRFKAERKEAATFIRELGGKRYSQNARKWAETLRTYLEALSATESIQKSTTLRVLSGPSFDGINTPFGDLSAVARWAHDTIKATQDKKGLNQFGPLLLRLSPDAARSLARFADADGLVEARTALIANNSVDWQRHSSVWDEAISRYAAGRLGNFVRSHPTAEAITTLVHRFEELAAACDGLKVSIRNVASAMHTDGERFLSFRTPATLMSALDKRLASLHRLPEWSSYYRQRERARDPLTAPLIALFETGSLDASLLAPSWSFVYHRALARRVFQSDQTLRSSTGASLSAARAEFRDLDAQVMQMRRTQIACELSKKQAPRGVPGPRVSNMTERSLLEHERSKQKGHRPIREVMKRSGQALKTLKPCFMMGPMAVAQYLTPGSLSFDVVIMDEASQLRPEEALGAVARGQQLIVVGDDRQLPPTMFFERIDDGEDGDDEEIVGQKEESVLRLAAQTFPGRMLLWHYRSKNESLIAFSNYHFYRNRLILFPTPNPDPQASGISFNFVEGGRFVEGVNDVEARAIATAAAEHLRTNSGQSLIVVAMNIKQKELIRAHFYELTKDDPAFSQSEDGASQDEPFDIKNLENVQGDERDVVMISMTYGPDPTSGRVARRFGPINGQHGHRRLNVLFSRAREKMIVFSSMRHGDVLLGENSAAGVVALRDFLLYAEHKILSAGASPVGSGRAPDSDFEIAVAEALSKHGYQCVAQLGAAGFFLDIAVRDPNHPTRFLLGIECDGATYHSTRSARDRDRLRQEVLEGLGWRIERIWSTDWFLDPDAQIRRMLVALNSVKSSASA